MESRLSEARRLADRTILLARPEDVYSYTGSTLAVVAETKLRLHGEYYCYVGAVRVAFILEGRKREVVR